MKEVYETVLPEYSTEVEHDGRKYQLSLPDLAVLRCRNCGEVYLDELADARLTDALRTAAGLLTSAQIRERRKALNLSQKQVADALRMPEGTLSRLEAGAQIQQGFVDVLLRSFFALPELRSNCGISDSENAPPNDMVPAPSRRLIVPEDLV